MDVKEKIELQDIIKPVTEYNKTKKHINASGLEGVYMFFSFDLVNSTAFKGTHPQEWRAIITAFYDITTNLYLKTYNLSREKERFGLWKYIGDEVLIYKKIVLEDEMYDNIIHTYRAKKSIMESLRKEYPKIEASNLDLKVCIWLADCGFVREGQSESYHNMVYKPKVNGEEEAIDFLGPDIDEGFRLSKVAEKGKVLISAKLSYLLWVFHQGDPHQHNIIESNFKIAYYTELKGIWDRRKYPVIIYSENFKYFYDELQYDEFLDSEIVIGLDQAAKSKVDLYHISILERIYRDLKKDEEVKKLKKLLQDQIEYYKKEAGALENIYNKKKQLQIHISAVCRDSEGKIALFKRKDQDKYQPSTWEFGCAKLQPNKALGTMVQEQYLRYGIQLVVPPNPIPIMTYSLEREGGVVPGIVIDAHIESISDSKGWEDKYSQMKMIDPLNIGEEALMVEQFKEVLAQIKDRLK